jgi:hypothetical protein
MRKGQYVIFNAISLKGYIFNLGKQDRAISVRPVMMNKSNLSPKIINALWD